MFAPLGGTADVVRLLIESAGFLQITDRARMISVCPACGGHMKIVAALKESCATEKGINA